ncbi:hypothetical protein B0T19DRAFT_291002 [Cercophora scortea]|uniref:Uncharacterized protein n=1 Tax=Cercophora scortea TaxID=314031 RepID=A0AAE0I2J2_9PEZI|nr:hypothetical protein B0T19DRAFT_291002 [Cercophora scortea]
MLAIESFFTSSFLDQLRTIVHMSASRDTASSPSSSRGPVGREPPPTDAKTSTMEQQPADAPATRSRPPRRRRVRITRPEVGSLYDIMHDHAGESLFVNPICWTDQHPELLGVRFTELPRILTPVPDFVSGRNTEPSRVARTLTSELHTLVERDNGQARIFCKNRAIKHVMATLFPSTLSNPRTSAELDLYFGQRVYRKAVRVPCVWKSPANGLENSFDSAPTLPSSSFGRIPVSRQESTPEYSPNQPILAYVNRSQLAMVRQNLFRVVPGRGNIPNEAVLSLQRLRSKMLIPSNIAHDSYIVSILLAMAQAHFYNDPSSKASSQSSAGSRASNKTLKIPPPTFTDVKVQVITHDEGDASNPSFIIYTAVVTPAFLSRFMYPHKAPPSGPDMDCDGGLQITYTPVSFWPILGLKERLTKALGREVAGEPWHYDPEHIGLWDVLVEPPTSPLIPAATLKRRRPLSEVLNSSFEDDATPTSSDDRPVLSPDAKRRRTARAASTLEVC